MNRHIFRGLALALCVFSVLSFHQSAVAGENVLQTVRNKLDGLCGSIPVEAQKTQHADFVEKCQEMQRSLIKYTKAHATPQDASSYERLLSAIIAQMADCHENLRSYLKNKDNIGARGIANPRKFFSDDPCKMALADLEKINTTYRTVFRGERNIHGYAGIKAMLKKCGDEGDEAQSSGCTKVYKDCLEMYGTSMQSECLKMKLECKGNAR
jgi:hypothetical protein